MPALGEGTMTENLPVPFEADPATDGPGADGDFFPDQRPEGRMYHSWKKDREAARMAATGHSPLEIAATLGLTDSLTGEPDERRAVKAIQRGLTAVYRFTVNEARLQELESLDEMERHLWQSLRREHVLVQQGRVIMIKGQTVQDERFVLECLDRILKIKERRAKYLGLDAQVRVSVEADQIGGEIASLIAAINASDDTVRAMVGAGENES